MIKINSLSKFLNKNYNILIAIISFFITALYFQIGGHWGATGSDANEYIKMYNGIVTESPYGYRIFIPYLASKLPLEIISSFALITFLSLNITTLVIANACKKISIRYSIITTTFWITSYTFIYNINNFVKVDPIVYLIFSYLIYLSDKKGQILQVILLIAIGIGSHEIMMVYLLKLLLDKIFNTNIAGGNNYSYKEIICIYIISFVVFIVIRKLILVEGEGWRHYINFFDRVNATLVYTKGYITHIIRIYATYGPILIYAACYLLFNSAKNNYKNILSYGILLSAVAMLSFTVADTLRIMSIIIIPVIFLASKYIDLLYEKEGVIKASSLIILQILHSILIFSSASYFKNLSSINMVTILISSAALILCLVGNMKARK